MLVREIEPGLELKFAHGKGFTGENTYYLVGPDQVIRLPYYVGLSLAIQKMELTLIEGKYAMYNYIERIPEARALIQAEGFLFQQEREYRKIAEIEKKLEPWISIIPKEVQRRNSWSSQVLREMEIHRV